MVPVGGAISVAPGSMITSVYVVLLVKVLPAFTNSMLTMRLRACDVTPALLLMVSLSYALSPGGTTRAAAPLYSTVLSVSVWLAPAGPRGPLTPPGVWAGGVRVSPHVPGPSP